MAININFDFKKVRISRDQQLSAIALAAIVIVIIGTLLASTRLLARIAYQEKGIEEIERNIEVVKKVEKDRDALIESYKEFRLGSVIETEDDADNQEIVLRALPYVYDKKEFEVKFQRFLARIGESYEYEGSIGLPDDVDETATETIEGQEGIVKIPMSLTVENLEPVCQPDNACLEKLFEDLDRMINPVKVTSVDMEFGGNFLVDPNEPPPDNQSDSDSAPTVFTVTLGLETYIKPRQDLLFEQDVTVPKSGSNNPAPATTEGEVQE